MKRIKKIVSGGQSGADRAALDFAIEHSIEYGGWCPKGGWAEDYPKPPGILREYGDLRETPSGKPEERTILNVRDSDGTLIFFDKFKNDLSPGTNLTINEAEKLNRKLYIVKFDNDKTVDGFHSWVDSLPDNYVLNIAGPRESESPGIYARTLVFLKKNLLCK